MIKGPLTITLSVAVSDDSFESRMSFPVDVAPEKITAMVLGWMSALDAALKAQVETAKGGD